MPEATMAELAACAHAAGIALDDRGAGDATIVLAGPAAGRIVAAVADAQPLVVTVGGDEHWCVNVPREVAASMHGLLLAAGCAHGAIAVSPQAVDLYLAARRARRTQHLVPNTTPTGGPAR